MKNEAENTENQPSHEVHPCVSTGCFWGHKWGKWIQYTQPIKTLLGEGIEHRQKKYCIRCNIVKEKVII